MKNKKILTIRRILVMVFLIAFCFMIYINFKGSYIEYQELGENYLKTFLRKQKIFYLILVTNLIVVYCIMYLTGRKIKKGLKIFFEQDNKNIPKLPNKSIAIVFSSIESIIIAIKFMPNIILCISNTNFGKTNPIFNLDVSFFMFIEPLIKMLIIYFIMMCISIIIYAFVYYVIVFNKYFDGIDKETLKENQIMKLLFRNIKLIAIGLSTFILIGSIDIVYDTFIITDNNIKLAGAGFVDSTIKFWGYNILAVVMLISIFRVVHKIKKGQQTKILADIAVVPIYLVLLFFVMTVFNFIFVKPNKFDKEKEYIEYNIATTKNAYGIECESETLNYTGTITVEEVESNSNIINNTVIMDKQSVLDTLKETQSGTGYYTFPIAKLSNYIINGKKELVYVSPREIISNRRTYNSKTYEYTHGYGLILSSATRANENGEIEYIQSSIDKNENSININVPQIYYGLETNGLVITNAKNKEEFDYSSDGKEYTVDYSIDAGLSLNWWDRFILALKQKNLNFAFSNLVTENSKILINRNIIKRAKIALSDVTYDEEPYTVVNSKGEIYWVLDAYTLSSSYPYSTYTEIEYNGQKRNINYIRNSIKVIINAYNGEIKYYITDRTDPIAMAYRKIYPEIFQDLDEEIPEDIKNQFIYPKFLYNVQSKMLEEYHNNKADVLYRSDDTWEKATYNNSQTLKKNQNTLDSYYTMWKNEQIGLIQMYTPKGKQNINAYLIGTVEDGKNILRLKVLQSDTNILGPTQLDTQLLQDKVIQQEINSLTVTGAKVTRNMVIVPVENTLLYIEPIYQTLLNENNIPKLKRVIVASGNKVAIGNNLTEAIESLISKYATEIELENTDDIDRLIDTIIKTNDNLSDSMESNNWELMGTDIKKLQELIYILEKRVKKEKEENTIYDENQIINSTNIIE